MRHLNHEYALLTYSSHSPVEEPCDMKSSSLTSEVEFYSYGASLSSHDIGETFKLALSEAFAHPSNDIIDSENLKFSVGNTVLILYPGQQMTWIMWVRSLWLMRMFVFDKRMAFEWQYIVLDLVLKDVGWGALMTGLGGKVGIE